MERMAEPLALQHISDRTARKGLAHPVEEEVRRAVELSRLLDLIEDRVGAHVAMIARSRRAPNLC